MRRIHLCYSCKYSHCSNPFGTGKHHTDCRIKKDNGMEDIYKCKFYVKRHKGGE